MPTDLSLARVGPSERSSETRARSASGNPGLGGLILQLAQRRVAPNGFQARRIRAAVASLPDGLEARLAGNVVAAFTAVDRDLPRGLDALICWAGHLESRGRLAAAGQIADVAVDLSPLDPELALHAARIARKGGNVGRAGELYRVVERLDDGTGRFTRLSRVGRAMMGADAEGKLSTLIRTALKSGDREGAAVAQEARAVERAARRDAVGAARDLLAAAVRYGDAADFGRIGHRLADLLVSAGPSRAARRVLEETARLALPEQARWARARLYEMARLAGDQVGRRRWRADRQAGLVSLSLARSRPDCAGPPGPDGVGSAKALETTVERFLDRIGVG